MNKSIFRSFTIGISISQIEHIRRCMDVDPNWILVEPEWSLFYSIETLIYMDLMPFYKALFEAFPKTPVMLMLPRPSNIHNHFLINETAVFSKETYTKYHGLYMDVLRDIIKLNHPNLKAIIIPELESCVDYHWIRQELKEMFEYFCCKDIRIGLNVDSLDLFFHHQKYKKFDFAIIEPDKMFFELYDDPLTEQKRFMKELVELRKELRRRGKPLIIRGEIINRYNHFEILCKFGFKHYIVDDLNYTKYAKYIKEQVKS